MKWIDKTTQQEIKIGDFVTANVKEGRTIWTVQGILISETEIQVGETIYKVEDVFYKTKRR